MFNVIKSPIERKAIKLILDTKPSLLKIYLNSKGYNDGWLLDMTRKYPEGCYNGVLLFIIMDRIRSNKNYKAEIKIIEKVCSEDYR